MDTGWSRSAVSSARRSTWVVIVGAAAVSVLMRLRMLWSPVTVDEGGYLAIARSWAHGKVLYRDVFVDRPQGVLVLFRVWDWLSGGSTGSIRIMAMLFGVLLVVSTAIVVRELAGDVAARFAAVICAVVSAAPVLEGYAANTELLSGAVSAAGLAIGLLAFSKRRPLVWFFASGLLAGVALSLKQTGFDGLVVLLVWLLICGLFGDTPRATVLRASGAVVAGLMTVLSAMMIHGALTGWSRWWAAVVGYRLKTQSAFAGADWPNLLATAPYAAVVLGTSAFLAVLGAGTVTRGWRARVGTSPTRGSVVLVVWFVATAMAFLIGGGFWRHYWLLLAAPLSALAGVGLAQLPRLRYLMLAATLVPCLAVTVWVYAGDQANLNVRADADHHAAVDQLVARWFDKHRQPGQNMYVMCASADVYADAHQDPGYPYLWLIEVHRGLNAQKRLVGYLGDPIRGPQFIAEYQRPSTCDASGRVGRILRRSYKPVAVIGHVTMLERNSDAVA
jgi:4-amino-4-deoxy-L-arabinose transferase-like glycosyltransferase